MNERPPYQMFDDLSEADYERLKEDIAARGVLVPVELDENGEILDGHQRVRICEELGMKDYPTFLRAGLTEAEKRTHARHLNLLRRHLTDEQKRAIVAQELAENPEKSSRQVADGLGVAHTFVADVRGEECATGVQLQLRTTIGADGRSRPATAVAAEARREEISKTLAENPEVSNREVARRLGVSDNTVRAVRSIFCATEAEARRAGKNVAELGDLSRIERSTVTAGDLFRAAKKTRAPRMERLPDLPEGVYSVLYADPPWQYDFALDSSDEVEHHYPTMTVEELCALPVGLLAATDTVLFLWTTSPKLPEAMSVIPAWGFTYKSSMVWDKGGLGVGYYARVNHELLLIATRGQPGVPRFEDRPASVIRSPRTRHSEKPGVFYEIIEGMYPEARRIELFARASREGWSAWGNEV